MHRLIMNTPDGMVVDHINGNGLDNQKVNLRNCTDGENKRNRNMPRGNTSGLKGVSWSKQNKKWDARISTNNKQICLGTFSNKEDAYRAYVDACQKYHGNFAKYD